jgi:SRSO17 transposase
MTEESLDGKDAAERRFSEYLEAIASVLGHTDRRGPVRGYVTGLLLPGKRKSVEPMAARIAPQRVQAAHQSLHHFVAQAEWSDEAVLDVVRARVLPAIERRSRRGSLTIRAFPRRGGILLAWPGSIAASWASWTTARSR